MNFFIICDPALRNPQKVAGVNGVLYRPLRFFTDYSSRMFISQFPAKKITEIDLEVCEKAKY